MKGLSELSGALPHRPPPQGSAGHTQYLFPFPGNMAVGPVSNAPASQSGGSESEWYRDYLLTAQPERKRPRREGIATEFLASSRVFWETGNQQLEADIEALKMMYVFRNERAVEDFISSHRTAAGVLSSALTELKKSFGEGVVFTLEAISDEDESTSLYAIAVWRGLAEGAERALEDFDERWWLDQPTQPGLTFTYELA